MYYYKVDILRVVDGDTVDVRLDLGFNVWHKCRVRMVGIYAPESRTRDLEEKKKGLAAKEYLKSILENPDNDIQMQSEGKGKYGRVLGIFFWDKGKRTPTNVNQLMIKEGHATSYFGGKRK